MSQKRINIFLSLLFLIGNIGLLLANEPLNSQQIALYSNRTGKLITTLNYSVEVNPSESSTNYLLTIENSISERGENLSLWIFNKKTDAQEFANRNSHLKVDDIQYFNPFCRNGKAKFVIPNVRKIEKHAVIPFDIDADFGSKVELPCVIYIASHKKKETIIYDEAQCKIEFILPKNIIRDEDGKIVTLELDKEVNPKVPLTPEEIEQQRQMKEDSIQQVRIKKLHAFISGVNDEMIGINTTINTLVQVKKYDKQLVDSIENSLNALKKKVDFQEMGNIGLFPHDEELMNNFTKFGSEYSLIVKKIEELKTPAWKEKWLMITAIVAAVMFAGMFVMQIWNQIKSKRQQIKMIKEMKIVNKKSQLDSLNDNELGKI